MIETLLHWAEVHAVALAAAGASLLVQSTLLIAAGLLAAACFRRRSAAVQSLILRATLVAVLVCPLAGWFLSRSGTRGFRIALPPLGVYAIVIALAIAVGVLLLIRLLLAISIVRRIRQAARSASVHWIDDAGRCARVFNVTTPPVLQTDHFTTPCLVGFHRPVILLPTAAKTVRHDVLVHELAHLRRRDCHWHLLCHIARALLWFQPLMWLLARRIELSADEVCDDSVLAYGGDRADYARALVDIAEQHQMPWTGSACAVGMAGFKSNVSRRVIRIMDNTRNINIDLRRITILLILALTASATLLAALLGTSIPAAMADNPPAAGARLPVPDAASAGKTEKVIRDVFGNYNASPLAERPAIAGKMIEQGIATANDPVARYVLLKDAGDLAASAGDAATAMRAATMLATMYALDESELKLTLLRRAASAATAPNTAGAVASEGLNCANEAAAAGNYDLASRFMLPTEQAARAAKNLTLTLSIQSRAADIKWLQQEGVRAKTAQDKLAKTPTDPESNHTLGRYFCIVRGDWEHGLIGLSKGANAAYHAAAAADLAKPVASDKQVAAGDLWWDIADKETAGAAQRALRRRAAYWYSQALGNPQFAGLSRALVEKRLGQIPPPGPGEMVSELPPAVASPAVPPPAVEPPAVPPPAVIPPVATPSDSVVRGNKILIFSGNHKEEPIFKAIGGNVRVVASADAGKALADPQAFGSANVIVWGPNALCDMPPLADNATEYKLRHFVNDGGDVVIFEQSRPANVGMLDRSFGITRDERGGPYAIAQLSPALAARVEAAGLRQDDLKAIRFAKAFAVPGKSEILIRGGPNGDMVIAASVPYGKGRIIVIGASIEGHDEKFDEVFFDYLYHFNSAAGRVAEKPSDTGSNILNSMVLRGNGKRMADGSVVMPGGILETPKSYTVPFRADFIAKTDSTSIRIHFAKGELIFNWEDHQDIAPLCFSDPAKGGDRVLRFNNKGHVPVNEFVQLTWIIEENSTRILVNGEERERIDGAYAGLSAPLQIFPQHGSVVTVKSVSVSAAGSTGAAPSAAPAYTPPPRGNIFTDGPAPAGGRNVLLFANSDSSRAIRLCKLIGGGNIRSVGPGEIVNLLANAAALGNTNVIVWQDNSLCDAPPNALNATTWETMRHFAEKGGDVVIFEQFRDKNWDLVEKTFGIRVHKGDGPYDVETVTPGLASKLAAAGISEDAVRKVRYLFGYDVPANSTVFAHNKKNVVIAAAVPYGSGRVIVIGGNIAVKVDQAFDEVLFDYIYHISQGGAAAPAPAYTPPAGGNIFTDGPAPAAIAGLTAEMNDPARWTIQKGTWHNAANKMRGEGDSEAWCEALVPRNVALSFRMNVIQGSDPRMDFYHANLSLTNIGAGQNLFPVLGPGAKLTTPPDGYIGTTRVGVPYANNQPQLMTFKFWPDRFAVEVDGKPTYAGTYAPGPDIRLQFHGGGKSGGITEFSDFRVEALTSSAAPAATPGLAHAVNLLPLIDTKRDTIAGTWQVDAQGLTCEKVQASRIGIPYDPPAEYNLHVAFTRQVGGEMQIMFGKPDHRVALIFYGENPLALALGGMDGKPWWNNPSSSKTNTKLSGIRHDCTLQVRRDSLTCILDGKQMFSFQTDYSNLNEVGWWSVKPHLIGVGANKSATVFHVIEVEELTLSTGAAQTPPAPADTPAPNANKIFTDGPAPAGNAALPADQQFAAALAKLKQANGGADIHADVHTAPDGSLQVDLKGQDGLVNLEPLTGLRISKLNLSHCEKLRSLSGLQGMPLTDLELSACIVLEGDLTALRGMRLTRLNLYACRMLKSLNGLDGSALTGLLDMTNCFALEGDLSALKGAQLTQINLRDNHHLQSLHGLEGMPLTGNFDMDNGFALEDISALKGMQLTRVSLLSCKNLRSLNGLQGMALKELVLPKHLAQGHARAILDAFPTLESAKTGDAGTDSELAAALKSRAPAAAPTPGAQPAPRGLGGSIFGDTEIKK